jgi:hypothetical protein
MPAVVPTPIGAGPEYRPRPAVHAACASAPLRDGSRAHLELFANGRVVVIPGGIGLEGIRTTAGRVTEASCRAHVWTLDATGVFRFTRRTTLGEIFAVWGRRLTPSRLLGFRGVLRVYRNGVRLRIDPRTLELRDRDQVVLQVGPFIPPHASYRFPRH